MPPRRRAARRTGRRTARRTTRRVGRRHRRRRRRRIVVGGAILVAAGAAAYGAYKLSQKDVERIEEYTGAPVEELEDDELQGAMNDLGIQSQELSDQDKAALSQDSAQAAAQPAAQAPAQDNYIDELERLADLRDRGIITEDEFNAKKKDLLGM